MYATYMFGRFCEPRPLPTASCGFGAHALGEEFSKTASTDVHCMATKGPFLDGISKIQPVNEGSKGVKQIKKA